MKAHDPDDIFYDDNSQFPRPIKTYWNGIDHSTPEERSNLNFIRAKVEIKKNY